VRVAATGREGGMVFKTLWNYVRVYRQQARALERLRAERAALERTQREVEAMTKKNEENERPWRRSPSGGRIPCVRVSYLCARSIA